MTSFPPKKTDHPATSYFPASNGRKNSSTAFAPSPPFSACFISGILCGPATFTIFGNAATAAFTGMLAQRPFKTVVELNKFLLDQKLTTAQAREFYRRAFVQINLNTGAREELLLIPGVGSRMSAELMEYRPWKTWAQFDKEIGKYVGQQETDRLKQYVFIPPS